MPRGDSSRGLEETDLPNVGVSIRAAEPILRLRGNRVRNTSQFAWLASGWRVAEWDGSLMATCVVEIASQETL